MLLHKPLIAVSQTAAVASRPGTAAAGRPHRPATEGTAPAPVASLTATAQNQLPWLDGLAITFVITLGGTVAMGWFDAMLPGGLAIAAIAIGAALVAGLTTRTRHAARARLRRGGEHGHAQPATPARADQGSPMVASDQGHAETPRGASERSDFRAPRGRFVVTGLCNTAAPIIDTTLADNETRGAILLAEPVA